MSVDNICIFYSTTVWIILNCLEFRSFGISRGTVCGNTSECLNNTHHMHQVCMPAWLMPFSISTDIQHRLLLLSTSPCKWKSPRVYWWVALYFRYSGLAYCNETVNSSVALNVNFSAVWYTCCSQKQLSVIYEIIQSLDLLVPVL